MSFEIFNSSGKVVLTVRPDGLVYYPTGGWLASGGRIEQFMELIQIGTNWDGRKYRLYRSPGGQLLKIYTDSQEWPPFCPMPAPGPFEADAWDEKPLVPVPSERETTDAWARVAAERRKAGRAVPP